jgi:hypothetical protein
LVLVMMVMLVMVPVAATAAGQYPFEFWANSTAKMVASYHPQIHFTYVPAYGSFNNLEGEVKGVKPSSYNVAVYIYVVGGWWTKPYWAEPLTAINHDGSWSCDITTGGVDENATEIRAYLVPKGYNPPLAYGEEKLSPELTKHSVARISVHRSP